MESGGQCISICLDSDLTNCLGAGKSPTLETGYNTASCGTETLFASFSDNKKSWPEKFHQVPKLVQYTFAFSLG